VPLLGSLAVLVAVSCQNDRKNLVGPAPSGKAHVPASFALAQTPSGATFTTDKDDYAPGDTLRLAGGGWQVGDSLDLLLDETPQNHPPVAWAVGIDTSGGFRDSSYVVQESDAGVTFALTATSRATRETATATFTDANPSVNAVTLNPTQPDPASPFTASFTVTINGSVTSPWRATGWRIYPRGSASGTYTCVDSPNLTTVGTSPAFSLALTTPSSAGEYTLDIQTYSDDGTTCASKVGNGRTTNFFVGTPDLTITKTHAGNFTAGSTGSYTITVTNSGNLATTSNVTVTDALPVGFTYSAATGTNWNCTPPTSQTPLTCSRGGGANMIAAGASAPPITLTVNVAADAPASITNTATVSGGGEPAAKNGNNSASDATTIVYPTVATTTAVSSSANPSVVGQSVTFTATVKVTATSAAVSTGTVTIFEGTSCSSIPSTTIASGTPNSLGQVSGATSSLTLGAHTIIACYGAATGFDPSNGTVIQTVNQAATSTAITSDPATSSVYGQLVTFTATVTVNSPGSGTPTGSVTFKTGGTSCTNATALVGATTNPATLDGTGKASFQISTLNASATAYTIRACYGGSSDFTASDNSMAFTVNPAQVTSSAAVSPSTQQYSDKVALSSSINIQSPGALAGQTLTGSVDFYIGATLIGTQGGVSITSVPAIVTLSTRYALIQAAGSYQVRARFNSANANFSSTSATTGETTAGLVVTKEDATINYPSSNPGAIPVSQTSFTLAVNVTETYPEPHPNPDPDGLAAPGNITNAGLSASLSGISTSANYNGSCTPVGLSGTGYQSRSFNCTFTGPFTVDAYLLTLTVTGNYYQGSYDDALTVFDPNAGFVTGGGTFLLGGDRVSFGLSFTYTKGKTTPRGGLVVIRHHADGGDCRIKSNSLDAPAVIGTTASYTGKGTYTCEDAAGLETASQGNLSLLGYVEDNATPGAGFDKFWIQAAYGEVSMPSPAKDNAALLTGGNIQVPQGR
jgi:uncharacterized repeat protein (TIGR01451 family)